MKNLKSKKSRRKPHGGKRDGAGRKKKPMAPPIRLVVAPTGLSAEQMAKHFSTLAIETLATIAACGSSESARVAASREILDRSEGKPKTATQPAKEDQLRDDFQDSGWGDLLTTSAKPAGRAN